MNDHLLKSLREERRIITRPTIRRIKKKSTFIDHNDCVLKNNDYHGVPKSVEIIQKRYHSLENQPTEDINTIVEKGRQFTKRIK